MPPAPSSVLSISLSAPPAGSPAADGPAAVHPSHIAAPGPSPSVQIVSDEQVRRVSEAIDHLPDDYRAVMALRYHDGLAFEEIGRRLGRSSDAARMLWARAVDRLK